jgi:hypothetical protein
MENSKKLIIYRDIDLSLTIHPLTGDISTKINEDAIQRSLRTIFLWEKWDVPFSSKYKNYIRELLFELPSVMIAATLKTRIEWLIGAVEPRINVIDVIVKLLPDGNAYDVTILYEILNLNKQETFNYVIQRIR